MDAEAGEEEEEEEEERESIYMYACSVHIPWSSIATSMFWRWQCLK